MGHLPVRFAAGSLIIQLPLIVIGIIFKNFNNFFIYGGQGKEKTANEALKF